MLCTFFIIIHSTIIESLKEKFRKCTNMIDSFLGKIFNYILSILDQQNSDNNFQSYSNLNINVLFKSFQFQS